MHNQHNQQTMTTIKSIFYFPPKERSGIYKNPYSINLLKSLSPYFTIKDNKSWLYRMLPKGLKLLLMSYSADIYIISWLESVCFGKIAFAQYIFSYLAIQILRIRKVKIVWIFHNIHPHQGNNFLSKYIQSLLFKNSNLIITHSVEAANYAKKHTDKPVVYKCHPFKRLRTKEFKGKVTYHDVFIWGTILPYKGILEFLLEHEKRQSALNIYILGKCHDTLLNKSIKKQCNSHISYDNKAASFDEIAAYIKNSKYVLFPYVGDCVSSSGALIDTISMQGMPVGPHKGAFIDLAKENLCLTYSNYTELFEILNNEHKVFTENSFIEENSWEHFGKFLQKSIKQM